MCLLAPKMASQQFKWLQIRRLTPLLQGILLIICLHDCNATVIDTLDSPSTPFSPGISAVSVSVKTPPIALEGRIGADTFADINKNLGQVNNDILINKVRTYLKREPKSGLAYEILGTLMFITGNMQEAAKSFKTAIDLEPEQSGPKTKLGILLMEAGQLSEAEALFLQALKITPSDRVASQRLGLLYEYQGKYPKAINYFQRGLIGTDNHYLGVAVNLGRLLNNQKRYQETIEILEPRLPLSHTLSEAHLILAAAYLTTGKYDSAKQRFDRVIELDETSREAKLGLAMLQKSQGKIDEAISQFKTLSDEQPTWLPAQLQLGDALLLLNRLEDAQLAFEKAIKLGEKRSDIQRRIAGFHIKKGEFAIAMPILQELIDSGEANVTDYTKLAELYRANKSYDKALITLQNGVQHHPENGYLYLRLGSEYATLREYDKAAPVLKKAVELWPNDPRVLKTYSLVLGKLGNTKEALKYAAILHSLMPNDTAEALFYATQLTADRQPDKAEAIYRKILTTEKDNVLALNNLANILSKDQHLQEAEKFARQANEVAQNNPHLMDTLGWILYQQHRYKEALVLLSEASKLAPGVAVFTYHKGMTQFELGDKNQARASLKQALEIDAKSEWAQTAKAKLAQ